MMELEFNYRGDHTDFDKWDWGEEGVEYEIFEKALSSILARRMAVIFSPNGAKIDINPPLSGGDTGDLVFEISVDVDQCGRLANISVPLSELIIDWAETAGSVWRRSAAESLRKTAEAIDSLSGCPDDSLAIWYAAGCDEEEGNDKAPNAQHNRPASAGPG